MAHPFDPRRKHKLDSRERKTRMPPEATLRELGLEPGQTVADIGCGLGFFTIPAAGIVGDRGRVYAIDSSEEMLGELRSRLARTALRNVEVLRSDASSLPLSPSSVSFALLANVLHEVEDPRRLLEEVRRILLPEGVLGLVEWQKREMPDGPPAAHRLAEEQVRAMLQDAGFGGLRSHPVAAEFYAFSARRGSRRA
jgi:ubiquinone/menaquinone biosynthesis C-methylase UbiE